jgi:hypothetical protein
MALLMKRNLLLWSGLKIKRAYQILSSKNSRTEFEIKKKKTSSECTDEEKLDAFAHLYNMSEVDGSVHVREVRLLLYSIKAAGIEFNDVVNHAKKQIK